MNQFKSIVLYTWNKRNQLCIIVLYSNFTKKTVMNFLWFSFHLFSFRIKYGYTLKCWNACIVSCIAYFILLMWKLKETMYVKFHNKYRTSTLREETRTFNMSKLSRYRTFITMLEMLDRKFVANMSCKVASFFYQNY